ncbi:MAG: ATP-binding protein [Gemmatimonadetes bacterium]|nr:ATP-binding protein [Gemmatimonadota bacterium]MCY3612135.1 ATP-binding protein [Gemmatimonadota bacterium]MCY3677899.1 ATP-binding protein [Gemmatimonadota bacterium]MYA43867.1 ATP-binding protein [Gemmatimonadota bacterium]
MTIDPWHFRRDQLADQVLSTLSHGPAQALSLFAPRRAGKTEFLVQDLVPHAEARGHRVIYASFWQAPLSPLAVLLHALEKSLEQGRLADRIRTSAWRMAPKLKLSAAIPGTGTGAEAEIDLTRLKGEPPPDLLFHLDDLLGRVSRKGRPTILLLDEVQELARSRSNAPLVAALRTGLDTRRDGLKAVFTGSSRAGLTAMFSNREAPFFHFATPIDLPMLGKPFVDHVVAVFRKTSKRDLDPERMLDAFNRLHRNPYFFRLLAQTMLYDAEHTISSALEHVRERIAADLGYPEAWLGLTPIQRETARALAMGAVKPFSRVFRQALGAALGDDPPSAAQVQAALRRLERLGIVDTARGVWELEDPGFGGWITARSEDRSRDG